MTRTAVVALGIGQCVNWGVLYYAFAVLVLPLERELGVPTWVVAGAFSVALLMSAALAPTVGRWCDDGRGATAMQAAGVVAAALLVVWTLLPGVLTLYVVWAALGLCMAAALYEPAFMIIGRAHREPGLGLRALATVTIFGGLASTVFLPVTARLLDAIGWRGAVIALAAILIASTGILRVLVFSQMAMPPAEAACETSHPPAEQPRLHSGWFAFIAVTFALVSFASAAFTSNLVPALRERNISPGTAATLGGLMGVMQLPGRAMLMSGASTQPPSVLLIGSLALLAVGFGSVALARSEAIVGLGTMVLALGAGLMTLVRPHLVHTVFGHAVGRLNGRIARWQQLARAAGPLTCAWTASYVSYARVLVVIAAAFALLVVMSSGLPGATRTLEVRNRGT